jgi:tetratricopeptide (TPR) repeat protein
MKPWEEIFPRIIKFTPEKKNRPALPEMPAALWEVAYAACLLGRFFPPFLVPALLAEEGKNPAMVERSLAFLAEKSVVESLSYPAPVLPEIAKAAEAKLNQNSIDKIRALVRSRLLAWTAAGKLKPCCRLLEALAALGEKGGSALALEAVRSDVANGTFSRFEKMLAENALPEIAGAENAAPLASVFRARKALAWGTAEELRAAGAEAPPGPLPPSFAPEAFASETAFSLSACDTESASTQVKEAMLAAQNENAPLARAYRLFSLLNVETKRFSDAIDYFGFAVEDAEKRGDLAELALAKFYAAQAHFLFGNLSRASRFALEAEETASLAGLAAWADRARFFRGRLCFEAGRYQEALDVFALLETAPHHSDSSELPPEAAPLFRETLGAWTYRCRAYLGETLRRSGQGGFDRRLFEIEAAYLSGDWKSAAELARDEGAPDGDRFLLLEQPDWRSGFAQCELLAFPLRDMRRRMFLAWRTLALCRFSAGAERDESIREMRRAMRDEISDADPADSFYGYAWYRILKSSGAPEVDQSTAISAAFKKMQIRAGRIDDNETKRAYLSLHRWNSALETAAREHKLL